MGCGKCVNVLIVIVTLQLTGCSTISAIITGSESGTASSSELQMVIFQGQKPLQRISVETDNIAVNK